MFVFMVLYMLLECIMMYTRKEYKDIVYVNISVYIVFCVFMIVLLGLYFTNYMFIFEWINVIYFYTYIHVSSYVFLERT